MEQKEGQFDWRVENKEENYMSFKTETLEPKIQGKTFIFNIKYLHFGQLVHFCRQYNINSLGNIYSLIQ